MQPYDPTNDFAATIKRESGALGTVWLPPTSLALLRSQGRVSVTGFDNAIQWQVQGVTAPDNSTVTGAWTQAITSTAAALVADPGGLGAIWPGGLNDLTIGGYDHAVRFGMQGTAWDVPEASEADQLVTHPADIGNAWIPDASIVDLLANDRVYVAGFDNGMLWGFRGLDFPAIWTLAEAGSGATFAPGLKLPAPPTFPTILNREGEDIGQVLGECSAQTGLPLWFTLACAKAESGLSHYAERWDGLTPSAQRAINAQDWGSLQNIINQSGEDISFSYGQQTLQLFTTRPYTTDKAMAVRAQLFNDPNAAMLDMCQRLARNVDAVQQYPQALATLGADPYLGALFQYNSGSYWHTDPNSYQATYGGNISNYRGAISWAKATVGG